MSGIFSISEYICIVYANLSDSCNVGDLITKKIDWLDIVYGVAAVFGIIMSGSRTVFVLTAVAVIWVFAAKSSGEKSYYFSVCGRRRCGGDIGCCSRKRRYS